MLRNLKGSSRAFTTHFGVDFFMCVEDLNISRLRSHFCCPCERVHRSLDPVVQQCSLLAIPTTRHGPAEGIEGGGRQATFDTRRALPSPAHQPI